MALIERNFSFDRREREAKEAHEAAKNAAVAIFAVAVFAVAAVSWSSVTVEYTKLTGKYKNNFNLINGFNSRIQ